MPQDDQKRLYQQCSETSKAGNNCRGKWLMVKKIPAITLALWATPKQPPVKKLTAVLFQITEPR